MSLSVTSKASTLHTAVHTEASLFKVRPLRQEQSTRNSKLETRASEASAGVTERNGEGGAGAQDSRLDGRLARLVGGRTRRGGSHPASGLAPRYQGDLATQSMQPLALLSPSLVLVFFSHRVMRLSSPPPFGRQLLRPTDRRCFLCLPC